MPRGGHIQAPADERWRTAIVAWALWVALALIFITWTSVQPVDGRSPSDRCEACRIVQVTPRPTPVVVGITPRPVPTVVGLPATDTE